MNRRHLLFRAAAVLGALLLLEGGLRLARFLAHPEERGDVPDLRCTLGVYRGKPWARTLWREQTGWLTEYKQYVGWGWRPFRGECLNIDARGMRLGWNPDPAPGRVLHVFGGSTVWGTGARDEGTLPSCLSRTLARRGQPFQVCNQGESGYMITQEILKLLLMLREGERPDLVVFYDGVNDVYNAYLAGKAGTTYNLPALKAKTGQTDLQRIAAGLKGLGRGAAERVLLCRLAVDGARRFSPHAFLPYEIGGAGLDEAGLMALAGEIAKDYRASLDLLDRLSKAYGFRYAAFWQPVLFTERRRVGEEAGLERVDPLLRLRERNLEALARHVNDRMASDPGRHFHNLSDALEGRTSACYIDFCHVTEEANAVLAERIADHLLQP